jgi:hypothetical protein
MKNQILNRIYFISIVVFIFANNCYSQRITKEDAIKIAESVSKNILTDAGSIESGKITIKRIDEIKYEYKSIGYVFYFSPGGYVVISGIREMTPIFSMSRNGKFETNFNSVETILKSSFIQKYVAVNSHSVSNNSIERSRNMWNQYLASKN